MKRLLWISLLMLIPGIFLNSCSDVNEAKSLNKQYTPVKIQILEEQPFNDYLRVTGTAKAIKEIQLVAEESGILKKVIRDKGSFVRKGDTLAVLENKIVVSQYQQAKAMLKQAELDFKAKSTLYEKKAISELEYLSSQYGLEAAQANYQLAKARYDKLTIVATISGLVNERYVDEGQYLTPMSPIFEIIDKRTIKMRSGVAERFFDEIKVGTPVTVTFDAFPGLKIESKVTYKSNRIDPLSRTFIVETEFPNPDNKISSEVVANVSILKKAYTNKIIVPQDVVLESEKGFSVFLENNNVVKRVPVEVENIIRDSMVISGLNPGDHLVVLGHRNIADNDTVEVIQ
ncbi:MAG: efflux RND transporter periplasmic adaptor subunit [Calditrichia bacterium]